MADWDDDEFELEEPAGAPGVRTDKWEGEDSDDDLKEEWDAESDDEKKSEEKPKDAPSKAIQKKKKKKLQEIIAEKEEARLRELEAKRLEDEENSKLNTPEGKLAEKLRLQKLAEDGDLELARDLAGISDSTPGINFNPTNKEEFDQLRSTLVEKLERIENNDEYQDFVCSLINELGMNLSVASLKKVKSDTEGYISAKLKEERAAKNKKAKPGKATIKMETDRSMFARGIDDYNDMDDFM